jgi:hypothetical protein
MIEMSKPLDSDLVAQEDLTGEFGGKLAQTSDAQLSFDKTDVQAVREDEKRMEAAAQPLPSKPEKEKSFAEKVEDTVTCVNRQPKHHDLLYQALKFCSNECSYEDTEAYLEVLPAYEFSTQSAYRLISFLIRSGGIDEIELDSEGIVITEEHKNELRELGVSEDEIEEIIVAWRLKTSDVGLEALQRISPTKRLAELFDRCPDRVPTFVKVLDFCRSARTFVDVTVHLDNDPGLMIDVNTGLARIQPGAYLNHLDKAGGISWSNGWKTTEEGVEWLTQFSVHK